MSIVDAYTIASEIGQPPLVSDTEFFAFVVGRQHDLGILRRIAVSRVLRREPWLTIFEREKAEAAQSAFVHPDSATAKADFDALWEDHARTCAS